MDFTGLTFSPFVPVAFLLLLAGLAVFLCVSGIYYGARGSFERMGFILFGILLLANPVALYEERDNLNDQLIIAVDQSASQNYGDRANQTEEALRTINESIADDGNIDVQLITIGDENSEATRLMDPLKNALRATHHDQLAGVILISDGLSHDRSEDISLDTDGAPVHLLLTGDRTIPDRRLEIERAPAYAIVGKPVEIDVRIVDQNVRTDSPAHIVIRQDGDLLVDRIVPVNQTVPVSIIPSKSGNVLIDLNVSALEDEENTYNNQAILTLNAVRDRLRVLLVSGTPHPGERVWRSVLRADPAVDLIHFTILRLPSSLDNTPVNELALIPFPTEELFDTSLDRFDLVIFDRYTLRGVLLMEYLQNLSDYVQNGGAILVASGAEFAARFNLFNTPLGQVLPAAPTGRIIEQPFSPHITEIGSLHPITAALLGQSKDWGRWFRMTETVTLDGQTLMEGANNEPLLVVARKGNGRVAQLTSDQIWMWSRNIEGGGPHRELLRRIVHWLMKEPDLEENRIDADVQGHSILITRNSLTPGNNRVSITGPRGLQQSLDLLSTGSGSYSGTYDAPEAGIYSLEADDLKTVVAVGNFDALEYRTIVPTAEILKPLADQTKGGTFWLEDGIPDIRRANSITTSRQFGQNWLSLPKRQAYRTIAAAQRPLIPPYLAALIMVLGLIAVWWRESR